MTEAEAVEAEAAFERELAGPRLEPLVTADETRRAEEEKST